MIELKRKEDCCGCGACAEICPKKCIALREDEEGFLYPHTDVSLCIDCHLCEKVCPVINRFERPAAFPEGGNEPPTFAAQARNDEIREASSSGGIFTVLGEEIIREGGVVFGARWDKDLRGAVLDCTETSAGLAAFRGSKYLQARTGSAYGDAQRLLKAGRLVLFTGTPCQIAGLKHFLRKDYENLLTAEVVCHGAPSPKVWRRYLEERAESLGKTKEKETRVEKIQPGGSLRSPQSPDSTPRVEFIDASFRDKTAPGGWKKYSLALSCIPSRSDGKIQPRVVREYFGKNVYMRAFLRNAILRPSCIECPAKAQTSGSDLTLGDFWGIKNYHPQLDDDKGTSLVCANSEKGARLIERIRAAGTFLRVPYAQALAGNPALEHNPTPHPRRREFFDRLNKGEPLHVFAPKITKLPLKVVIRGRVFSCAAAILKRFGIDEFVRNFLRRKRKNSPSR